jgi:hypothetical protein
MKSQAKKIVPSPLTLAAGRALRRAVKVARKTARRHEPYGRRNEAWQQGVPSVRRHRERLGGGSLLSAACHPRSKLHLA